MKQSLQLRIGQSLTMTPQLQQAIRLLQLSTLELSNEIQDALDSNMMLEAVEDNASQEASQDATANKNTDSNETDNLENNIDASADSTPNEDSTIPDELPVDTVWEDIYDSMSHLPTASSAPADNTEMEVVSVTGESLQQHLDWQRELAPFSQTDSIIAQAIIDSINEDGFLAASIEDIHQGLVDEYEIELDEVAAVLRQVQNFDPPGIAARNLQESLSLQLDQLDGTVDNLEFAKQLVNEHFEYLANRDYNQIMRLMKLSEEELKEVVLLVQSLNPRPGGHITDSNPEYIVPDVVVSKKKDKWVVELNPDAAPKIRINNHYASLIKQVNNSNDNTNMKNHLQEARWFIKSLQSRNETLLKVSTSIVNRQLGFLEHGEEAMKALVLHDIAEEVEMHESTISRVTTKKYMHTPRGIFELKYFFSSHVSTTSGGECSATAIRALLKKLIAAENRNKPLSDSKLADILADQGIKVARRTVAKYRESLSIPSSNERKQLT